MTPELGLNAVLCPLRWERTGSSVVYKTNDLNEEIYLPHESAIRQGSVRTDSSFLLHLASVA